MGLTSILEMASLLASGRSIPLLCSVRSSTGGWNQGPGISTCRVCVNNTISEMAGTFQNPGELWEVMKRSLRQLSVDADVKVVAELAIVLAHDFPTFAERVVNVLEFILERESGDLKKAVFVVMIINRIVLQGAAILGPTNPYITIVNRHLPVIVRVICLHGGDVRSTFHECIRSWILRGLYPPFLFHQVFLLESKWARNVPMSPRPRDYGIAVAENSPDILDMVWVGIGASL